MNIQQAEMQKTKHDEIEFIQWNADYGTYGFHSERKFLIVFWGMFDMNINNA